MYCCPFERPHPVNDIHRAIKYSSVYHFTDDTNLLKTNTSPQRMQKQVNLDLKSLYKWLLANKISLNYSNELIFFHKTTILTLRYKISWNLPRHTIVVMNIVKSYQINWRANDMISKVWHYIPRDELKSI